MLFIHGIGHFHPAGVITNEFLQSLDIDVDPEWIIERVGIHTRRTVLPLEYIRDTKNSDRREALAVSQHANSEMGALAARMALGRAHLEPAAIGLVVAGGSCPQFSAPGDACTVAGELGITAPALDINAACSSLVAQLNFLFGMQPAALPDYVLIVNVEAMTRTVDYTDRRTAVLFGDAATALIVSPRVPSPLRVRRTLYASDPMNWQKVQIPTTGYFGQDGSAVQMFAIKKSVQIVRRLATEVATSRFMFVGHQANLLMLEGICGHARIATGDHLHNVERFGNCAAAGAPSVLSENWNDLPKNASIALVAVGAGLSWGGALIETGSEA